MPSAFPVVASRRVYTDSASQDYTEVFSEGGMSLRQWYAGQALAGLCAAMGPEYRPSRVIDMAGTAEDAFSMADEMMKKIAEEAAEDA